MSTDLDAVVQAVAAEPTFERAMSRLLAEARRLTHAEAGTVYLRDAFSLKFAVVQNDVLAARFGVEDLTQHLAGEPLPLSLASIAGYVALTRAAVNLADVYDIGLTRPFAFKREVDRKNDYRTRSMLALPLRDRKHRVVGVLQLINARASTGEVVPFAAETEDRAAVLLRKLAPAFPLSSSDVPP